MVKYSPRAAQALSYLKRSYNDIDIFVEDTGNHNMWLLLLRRILPNRIRLTSVNLLGGRDRVEEACRLDQLDTGRRKLYIIDGDFDYLHGRPKKRLKHLYRLRSYCIENLIIHEGALIQSAMTLQPMMKEREIQRKIDFNNWSNLEFSKLSPLFVVYAVVKKLMPSVQTVAYAVSNLFLATPAGPTICKTKVKKRIITLLRALRENYDLHTIRSEIKMSKDYAKKSGYDQSISGKDYIIPLVWLRMKCLFKYQGSHEQLKVLLAQYWNPHREAFFRRRLLNIAGL